MGLTEKMNRSAARIRWLSIGLIAAALLVFLRALPVNEGVGALRAWIDGLGIWGPFVFACVYVVATVLCLPGSALTLAGGAVFGLLEGTAAVSVGSTIGAALAFLIGRYLARERIAKLTREHPRFDAIDQAIGQGGWRIVALLRLSPAVPFNLQNYLYGVTKIGFWPCVLTSWIAMLPGTFMYVYLGRVGGAGVEAAAGAGSSKTAAEWVLLGVGLLATVVVTIYVTRLAARAVRQRTQIERDAVTEPPAAPSETPAPTWPWGATLTALAAVLMMTSAGYAYANPGLFSGWFGPPPLILKEAYVVAEDGPTFDHAKFDALLKKHVDDDGWVNYSGFDDDEDELDDYLLALAEAPFDEMGRNEKLALLINAYNACTIRLILDHFDDGNLTSIRKIPDAKRWKYKRWNVGSNIWSLDDIEHKQIRPKFKEPRIHFALVCAAVGCPKLRNEAYVAERIAEQLEDQARYAHAHERWFRFESRKNVVRLTKLYKWYGDDFKQVAGSVLEFAARYSPELKKALDAGKKPTVKWLEYNWNLNDEGNRR